MGSANRNATSDLNKNLILEVQQFGHEFNFYQLMELLQRHEGLDPETYSWERDYKIFFESNPSLGFAPADINSVDVLPTNNVRLTTNFLSLSGASSPLPGYILEQLLQEEPGGMKRAFFDFFNNRLISLSYRIWRKYRYYIRFKPGADDRFSEQVFALVGLSDNALRGETPINWSKMLPYAGLLAGRSRAPQVVEGIIAHCFDLQQVNIKEWVHRRVLIDKSQLAQLGQKNMQLGDNAVLGDKIDDISGKYIISISQLTRETFADFLPSGKNFLPLKKLVEFVMRDQLAYDIELVLDKQELKGINYFSGMELGWTSFLGEEYSDSRVRIQGGL